MSPTPNDMPGSVKERNVESPQDDQTSAQDGQQNDDNGTDTDDDLVAGAVEDPQAEIERLRKILRQSRKFEERARKNAEKARKWDENAEKIKQFEEWQKSQQTKEEQQANRIKELETELTKAQQASMRSTIASELNVPARFITGTTEAEMRESAEEYVAQREADVDARLKAMGVSAAAPASAVTSDGKGNEVKQLTKADLANMSRKEILAAEKAGQLDDALGRTK